MKANMPTKSSLMPNINPTQSDQPHSTVSPITPNRDSAQPITNPTKLFVGDQHTLQDHVITYIQQQLCPHNACNICNTCQKIRNKQHHAMQWFCPEKVYTRDELAPLFHTLSFALDDHERIFIIIEKADYLTTACANSLLKSLEEPPTGYHFVLLTDRMDQILPTIRSRCTTQTIHTQHTHTHNDPLFHPFTTTTFSDPSLFLKTLDKEKPSEQRSIALLDQLLGHWITLYKSNINSEHNNMAQEAETVIAILHTTIKYPPMPGSSKTMWKNLFLQIKNIKTALKT